MRAYARYVHNGVEGIGVVLGDRIHTADPSSQLADLGDRALTAAALTGDSIPIDEVRFLPPIGAASRVIGVGLAAVDTIHTRLERVIGLRNRAAHWNHRSR